MHIMSHSLTHQRFFHSESYTALWCDLSLESYCYYCYRTSWLVSLSAWLFINKKRLDHLAHDSHFREEIHVCNFCTHWKKVTLTQDHANFTKFRSAAALPSWIIGNKGMDFVWYNLKMDAWVNHKSIQLQPTNYLCIFNARIQNADPPSTAQHWLNQFVQEYSII